jgi:hypothetical protein
MWVGSSYLKTPPLKFVNFLSPCIMIPLTEFLEKHNSGRMPKVYNTKGRQMMFVQDSMEIPRIFIAKKLKITKEEDLDGKFVISTSPEGVPNVEIYVVCDTSMSLAY